MEMCGQARGYASAEKLVANVLIWLEFCAEETFPEDISRIGPSMNRQALSM
jgi:hypothetical protein